MPAGSAVTKNLQLTTYNSSTQSGVSVENAAKLEIAQALQDVEDFFVALERRDQVRTGHFRA